MCVWESPPCVPYARGENRDGGSLGQIHKGRSWYRKWTKRRKESMITEVLALFYRKWWTVTKLQCLVLCAKSWWPGGICWMSWWLWMRFRWRHRVHWQWFHSRQSPWEVLLQCVPCQHSNFLRRLLLPLLLPPPLLFTQEANLGQNQTKGKLTVMLKVKYNIFNFHAIKIPNYHWKYIVNYTINVQWSNKYYFIFSSFSKVLLKFVLFALSQEATEETFIFAHGSTKQTAPNYSKVSPN